MSDLIAEVVPLVRGRKVRYSELAECCGKIAEAVPLVRGRKDTKALRKICWSTISEVLPLMRGRKEEPRANTTRLQIVLQRRCL